MDNPGHNVQTVTVRVAWREAGMYIVTTVHSCLEFDEKRGICVTYGATNSRLFEASVLYDPNRVYERIKDETDPGFCDQSFIGIREAAHAPR